MSDTFTREDMTAKPAAAPAQVETETPSVSAADASDESTVVNEPAETTTAESGEETPETPADPASDAPAETANKSQASRAQERIEDLVAQRNALREAVKHYQSTVEQLARNGSAPAQTAQA